MEHPAPINETFAQGLVQNASASPNFCDASLLCADGRTTLMVRGMPCHWYRCMFVANLEEMGFKGLFNLVYLPVSFKSGESVGYGFVNLVDHANAIKLLLATRLGELSTEWSDVQGYDANVEHFRNSSVMHFSVPVFCKPAVYDANGNEVAFPSPTKRVTRPRIHWKKDSMKDNEISAALTTHTER